MLPDRILFIPAPCHREYTRLVGSILSSCLHPFLQEADPGAAPADTSSLPDVSLSSSFQIRLPSLIHAKCRYHIFRFFYYDSLLLSLRTDISWRSCFFHITVCVLEYVPVHLSMYLSAVLSANENTFSTLENMLSLTDKIIACFSVKIFSNAIRCHK